MHVLCFMQAAYSMQSRTEGINAPVSPGPYWASQNPGLPAYFFVSLLFQSLMMFDACRQATAAQGSPSLATSGPHMVLADPLCRRYVACTVS